MLFFYVSHRSSNSHLNLISSSVFMPFPWLTQDLCLNYAHTSLAYLPGSTKLMKVNLSRIMPCIYEFQHMHLSPQKVCDMGILISK